MDDFHRQQKPYFNKDKTFQNPTYPHSLKKESKLYRTLTVELIFGSALVIACLFYNEVTRIKCKQQS